MKGEIFIWIQASILASIIVELLLIEATKEDFSTLLLLLENKKLKLFN